MQRLITGVLIGSGWIALLLYGQPLLFWAVVSLCGLMAIHEYCAMALTEPTAVSLRPFIVLAAAAPLLVAFFGYLPLVSAALFLAFLCLLLLTILAYKRLADPFAFLSRALFGTLSIGFCTAHLPLLFTLPAGGRWLLLLTAIIVASDAGAYYSGRTFGRRKLCPAVSPNKTVEGLAGGLILAVAVALVLAPLLFDASNFLQTAVVAFMLSCVGAAGDLAESVVKRAMGVKDSGTLLPGHGGMLDRADSMLLAAPFLYYLVYLGLM